MGLIYHHFTEGRNYIITDARISGYSVKHDSHSSYCNPDKNYIFVFVRKEGKHHIFREKTGGWTRTYTDQQLHGKKIEELEQ